MDVTGMGFEKQLCCLKNNKGQSTVEYVLLMAVALTFMTTVWNSNAFKEFFSEDSNFFTAFSQRIRTTYQFAANTPLDTEFPQRPTLNHPSFVGEGATRFFTHDNQTPYPAR